MAAIWTCTRQLKAHPAGLNISKLKFHTIVSWKAFKLNFRANRAISLHWRNCTLAPSVGSRRKRHEEILKLNKV
jgi:hypothetical protein